MCYSSLPLLLWMYGLKTTIYLLSRWCELNLDLAIFYVTLYLDLRFYQLYGENPKKIFTDTNLTKWLSVKVHF